MRPVPADSGCDDGQGLIQPTFAGHGTHVAGLVAGREMNGSNDTGACKNCGLMVWRVSETRCVQTTAGPRVFSGIADESRLIAALVHLGDIGAQIVNMSFGSPIQNRCVNQPAQSDAYCLAIPAAELRGVMMVSSSGNDRVALNFPAEDPRVVAVGGIKESGAFWEDRLDLSPLFLQWGCVNPALLGPWVNWGAECGSNYFAPDSSPTARQESVLPSLDVFSTIYTGRDWNPLLECEDTFAGGSNDGYGLCTGTSMSAPI